jgi:hypothetical protein
MFHRSFLAPFMLTAACGGALTHDANLDGGTTGASGTGAPTTSTGGGGGSSGGAGGQAGLGGASAGSGGASGAAGPTGIPPSCASGTYWTGGIAPSPMMSPGTPCMSSGCHAAGSPTAFTLSGTVYTKSGLHDDDNCNGADGTKAVAVVILNVNDVSEEIAPRIPVNAWGNFFVQQALPPSFRVKVLHAGSELLMMSPVTDGNCNACHTAAGTMNAAGRIAAEL